MRISFEQAHFDAEDWVGAAIQEYLLAGLRFDGSKLLRDFDQFGSALAFLTRVLAVDFHKHDWEPTYEQACKMLLLREIPDSYKLIDRFLEDCKQLAEAVSRAGKTLRENSPGSGRPSLHWYDIFVDFVSCIARQNNISLSCQDRKHDKPKTAFLAVVGAYEMCLEKGMRSPSRAARAKRVEQALKRLDSVARRGN